MVRVPLLLTAMGSACAFHAIPAHRVRVPPLAAEVEATEANAPEFAGAVLKDAPEGGGAPQKREAYYCNDQGCWVAEEIMCDETGCWIADPAPPEQWLLEARALRKGEKLPYDTEPKRTKAPQGIFAPAVLGAKSVMGTKELNALRANIISKHTKVINAFVDTSESEFGQIVLKRMFEAADKDNSGGLDKEEVREALRALGFAFIENKEVEKIMKRADLDGNEVIDFEEFVKETPKTLRKSLVKLAKQNGHDLGFLA